MQFIRNPILKGFNPDPSIIRVGEDYYIANSTFQWFPGVQIHHSRDLAHWRLLTRPLSRLSQLDMKGNLCSGGVWAPCLTWHNGVFYLVYSDLKNIKGTFKDCHNYLVTATDIEGEWSDPVYLNSSGFDPSLFHDDDGRKWLVNMYWDHRGGGGRERFGGIVLQEYSEKEKRMTGPVKNIFKGSALGVTEGPHLYKRNGYYYLLTAEGGTGDGHAVTVARSKKIDGPYEIDPTNPILTSVGHPDAELRRSGHADIVETRDGQWYMAHLCARPLKKSGRCVLGRETAIQKVTWTEDGWLRLACGGNKPELEVKRPGLPECPWQPELLRDDFDSEKLNIHFQSLRIPLGEDILTLKERPGYLRLKGKESLNSRFTQALVARRQQAFSYAASTCMEFEPDNYNQMAGLVCLYDVNNFYYLKVSRDEKLGKAIGILNCDEGVFYQSQELLVPVEGWKRIYLKVEVREEELRFFYSADGQAWKPIGEIYDASKLSDDYGTTSNFTGAFAGLCCQDLDGSSKPADFDFFEYSELSD
jgi:xylan 1,4-beta-xylosidase